MNQYTEDEDMQEMLDGLLRVTQAKRLGSRDRGDQLGYKFSMMWNTITRKQYGQAGRILSRRLYKKQDAQIAFQEGWLVAGEKMEFAGEAWQR